MEQDIRRLFEDVTNIVEGRELLEANSIGQEIVFRIEDDDDVVATIEPGSTDVTVDTRYRESKLFATTELELDRKTLEQLLGGDFFSEHYLEGGLRVKGLPSIKILLGQLFRVNRERQAR